MTWLHKTWLRLLALMVAACLTVFALVSLAAAPAWPVIGVTMAAMALVWKSSIGPRIVTPACLHCGASLKGQPTGEYGAICRDCGGLNHPFADQHSASV